MDINNALEKDGISGAAFLQKLEATLTDLYTIRNRYPASFEYLCEEGRKSSEMLLGDAISAMEWACDHVAEVE